MEYRSGLVAAASLAFVAVVIAACSSSSSSDSNPAADAGEGGVVVAEDLCKKTGDYELCFACCNPGDGYIEGQQTFQNCMCQGACKAPCATSICADPDGGPAADETDECDNCLNTDPSAKGCADQAQAACAAIPDCQRFTQCINDACEALPDSDAGH